MLAKLGQIKFDICLLACFLMTTCLQYNNVFRISFHAYFVLNVTVTHIEHTLRDIQLQSSVLWSEKQDLSVK